jgi:hypothetical protein
MENENEMILIDARKIFLREIYAIELKGGDCV